MSESSDVHVGEIVSGDKLTLDDVNKRTQDACTDSETNELSVGETSPKAFGEYAGISYALRDGAHLHGFRSGGGLRVIRLEKPRHGNLLGYGEHPYIEQAFDYCEEDIQAGTRNYKEVYGVIHDHFLTGCSTPSSEVDRWMLAGRELDINFNGDLFTFDGKHSVNSIPRKVTDRVAQTRQAEWFKDHRGFLFEIIPFVFPGNGEHGSSAKTIVTPPGYQEHDAYRYERPVVLMSPSLSGLLAKMNIEFLKTWGQE